MKRTLYLGALLVLAATSAACSFDIFEDIGTDPHPPTVEIIALLHYDEALLEPTTTKAALSPPARASTWDSGGFTVSTGQKFLIGRAYTDAGADIVRFSIRDRDGPMSADLTPNDQNYYSGTSGTILGPAAGLELKGVFGRHRLELWAEDSHGSRSEKVEFVITLADL